MVVIGQNWVLRVLWPFGAKIGSGQKGPNWPTDRRGHRGPNEKGWFWLEDPEPLRKQKDTPRPKKKDKDLGVGDMEGLAREAKDGRIWPKGHRAPEGGKLAIKIWCGQLAPAWSQVGIATTPMEEGHSLWL
ncbi:hypothetical protein O181_007722 [Austropuccinia psidii MF-1]|uniref:Uncharacterized protein n=1 Tax=Austropuccinia psidii MF-1 TaxID=1389203 RepID=A0A9Q3BMH4_9BASI|nr:hypothetical protein [Austropuccinia psidii MF-1]